MLGNNNNNEELLFLTDLPHFLLSSLCDGGFPSLKFSRFPLKRIIAHSSYRESWLLNQDPPESVAQGSAAFPKYSSACCARFFVHFLPKAEDLGSIFTAASVSAQGVPH